MDISLSTWMMAAFVIGTVLSIWKVYPFMKNHTLEDDDRGEDSHEYLVDIMHKVLADAQETPDTKELHEKMLQHKEFDKEKYWRFNLNKLNQLLFKHYAKHPHLNSIEDIHTELKNKD